MLISEYRFGTETGGLGKRFRKKTAKASSPMRPRAFSIWRGARLVLLSKNNTLRPYFCVDDHVVFVDHDIPNVHSRAEFSCVNKIDRCPGTLHPGDLCSGAFIVVPLPDNAQTRQLYVENSVAPMGRFRRVSWLPHQGTGEAFSIYASRSSTFPDDFTVFLALVPS